MPDPLNDPNVYKIQPEKVNITLAPPEHLNPQYQEYLANEPDRFKEVITQTSIINTAHH